MAITIDGSGTITGINAGGLPDGVITSDDLASGAITAAGLPAGSILQVVSATKSDTSSVTGYSWTDTGLSVSITPTSTNSKILVLADMNIGGDNMFDVKLRLLRGSTAIGLGDAVGSRPQVTRVVNSHAASGYGQYHQIPTSIIYLDSPSTTSATTDKVQFATYDSGLAYMNKSHNNSTDPNNEYEGTPASFITVMEVAG